MRAHIIDELRPVAPEIDPGWEAATIMDIFDSGRDMKAIWGECGWGKGARRPGDDGGDERCVHDGYCDHVVVQLGPAGVWPHHQGPAERDQLQELGVALHLRSGAGGVGPVGQRGRGRSGRSTHVAEPKLVARRQGVAAREDRILDLGGVETALATEHVAPLFFATVRALGTPRFNLTIAR